MSKLRSFLRNNGKIMSVTMIALIVLTGFIVMYRLERQEIFKGEANYQLGYNYYLKNNGPLNLSSVSIRLAALKDWAPVQNVSSFAIHTTPNQTTTDEYENQFLWYEYANFQVNQSIDLKFDANLTLYFVDYSTANLPIKEYDTDSDEYKLFTAYHPLTDTTDPNIQRIASEMSTSEKILDSVFNIYNFTSSYLRYQLLSSIKGASYALSNGIGDCDEFTSLFIALSRASGVPAVGHTAWFADFEPGFVSSDDGTLAHAYPMFYLEGVGMIPTDPTRGNKNLFDNWVKSDHKRITLTRGPNHAYRILNYKWIPVLGFDDPVIDRNYTISIKNVELKYYSTLRLAIIIILPSTTGIFILSLVIRGVILRKEYKKKIERLTTPQ